ncbi:MAG: prepilin-type N-terminal cleavage/methylation domain-containing protein [Deltaproteobacteria bacterium]|jgi:prepilin-type N-terminal cleavage/methylation domain-containing protein|nr:prepilin-type N-terminal cleavage/methylation domain-containing protein [Deltaproteobacteria bacterium]
MTPCRLNPVNVKLRRGLTLVELLTVMLLGSILISMSLLIYITTSRSYVRQDAQVEQMLNLRSAMAFISRDLRVSGSGYSLLKVPQKTRILAYSKTAAGQPDSWFHYPGEAEAGVQPIWFSGATDKPDVISVSYMAPEFSAPLGRLAADLNAGAESLSLTPESVIDFPAGLDKAEILAPGDNIAVVSGQRAVILDTVSYDNLETIKVLKSPAAFPAGFSFPAGALIYNVRKFTVHTFRVDPDSGALLLDTLDDTGEILAEGIEDLQIGFTIRNEDPFVEANLIQDFDTYSASGFTDDLTLSRVVLVSRSQTRDPYNNTYPRLSALDHPAVGADAFRRRSLEALVSLRNY